jgi:hypothetical protein
MLAGVRNVACCAAIVMAGLWAVILANCVWVAGFRLEAVILWPQVIWEIVDPWTSTVMWSRTESLIAFAVVIWLIGRAVRHVSKSRAAGR